MAAVGRAVFVGEDALTVECGRLWLGRGYELAAVAAESPAVRDWAHRVGVPHATQVTELAGLPSVDYLFSVAQPRLLPEAVLRLAGRLAVNFHDGLLPRDAGTHPTAWAILRGAREHGITWHAITLRPDAGDILVRRRFAVGPEETSGTLNARCFEAGLAGFAELVDRIAAGTLTRVRQDLAQRTYHAAADRPAGALTIDWSEPVDRIAALVRACDFGGHANGFGTAKLAIGDRLFAVGTARATAAPPPAPTASAPATAPATAIPAAPDDAPASVLDGARASAVDGAFASAADGVPGSAVHAVAGSVADGVAASAVDAAMDVTIGAGVDAAVDARGGAGVDCGAGRVVGTVVSCGADELTVRTVSGEVVLGRLTTLAGRPVDLAGELGLRPGDPLGDLPELVREAFTAVQRAAVRCESWWVSRLSAVRPMDLPGRHTVRRPTRWHTVDVAAPEDWPADEWATVAAVCAYLAPTGPDEPGDIGVRAGAGVLAAPVAPLAVPPLTPTFAGYAKVVAARLGEIGERGPYLRDVFLRYPALRHLSDFEDGLPIEVDLSGRCGDPGPGTVLRVAIGVDGECRWSVATAALPEAEANALVAGFAEFWQEIRPDAALDRMPPGGGPVQRLGRELEHAAGGGRP